MRFGTSPSRVTHQPDRAPSDKRDGPLNSAYLTEVQDHGGNASASHRFQPHSVKLSSSRTSAPCARGRWWCAAYAQKLDDHGYIVPGRLEDVFLDAIVQDELQRELALLSPFLLHPGRLVIGHLTHLVVTRERSGLLVVVIIWCILSLGWHDSVHQTSLPHSCSATDGTGCRVDATGNGNRPFGCLSRQHRFISLADVQGITHQGERHAPLWRKDTGALWLCRETCFARLGWKPLQRGSNAQSEESGFFPPIIHNRSFLLQTSLVLLTLVGR